MTREPLATLPLARFVPAAHTIPSPISLPTKRSLPSGQLTIASTSSSSTASSTSLKSAVKPAFVSALSSRRSPIVPVPAPAGSTTTASASVTERGGGAGPERKVRRISQPLQGHEGGQEGQEGEAHGLTPKARAVLERDDLGLGRSPARRLFKDADKESPSTSTASPSRLAPSPPIHTRRRPVTRSVSSAAKAQATHAPAATPNSPFVAPSSSPSVTTPRARTRPSASSSRVDTATSRTLSAAVVVDENGAERNLHDIGFVIYNEYERSRTVVACSAAGLASPDSKRRQQATDTVLSAADAIDATAPLPPPSPVDPVDPTYIYASSSSSNWPDNDQENVPPSPSRTTPSSRSLTSGSGSASSARVMSDAEIVVLGSGTNRRRIERSKLATESVSAGSGVEGGSEDEEADELTPGRKVVRSGKDAKDAVKREAEKA